MSDKNAAGQDVPSVEWLGEPKAWMRRWCFDGEEPKKEKRENGKWAWPHKFRLKEVTLHKCLKDDVPLYAPKK